MEQPQRHLHSLEKLVAIFALLGVLLLSVGFAQAAGDKRRLSAEELDRLRTEQPARVFLRSSVALVMNAATGEVLLAKNADAILPIASITKLMTAIVILDRRLNLRQRIVVSADDVDTVKGTRSRLRTGSVLTRGQLMLLTLMSSENRAAAALGRTYPGGTKALVAVMNKRAKLMGMKDTRFVEPTGLSHENVSSAADLARLVGAASRYTVIRDYSTRDKAEVESMGRRLVYRNTNGLVSSPNWNIRLSKTGYLSEAGRCLVMRVRVASKELIVVLLDSYGKYSRIGDANRIRKWLESSAHVGRRS